MWFKMVFRLKYNKVLFRANANSNYYYFKKNGRLWVGTGKIKHGLGFGRHVKFKWIRKVSNGFYVQSKELKKLIESYGLPIIHYRHKEDFK